MMHQKLALVHQFWLENGTVNRFFKSIHCKFFLLESLHIGFVLDIFVWIGDSCDRTLDLVLWFLWQCAIVLIFGEMFSFCCEIYSLKFVVILLSLEWLHCWYREFLILPKSKQTLWFLFVNISGFSFASITGRTLWVL